MKKITYPILKELLRYRRSLSVAATLELLNQRHAASWAETDLGGALTEAGPAYAAEAKKWKQPTKVAMASRLVVEELEAGEPLTLEQLRSAVEVAQASVTTLQAAIKRLVQAGVVTVVNPGRKPFLYAVGV